MHDTIDMRGPVLPPANMAKACRELVFGQFDSKAWAWAYLAVQPCAAGRDPQLLLTVAYTALSSPFRTADRWFVAENSYRVMARDYAESD